MSRRVILLLTASLIILVVGGSIFICLMVTPSSIKCLKWDHKISDMKNEKNKHYLIRLLKRAMRIEYGFLLKTIRSTGETFRRHRRDNVLNENNDWAILKNGKLWDENLIRRMKRGVKVKVLDDTMVIMI